jgi:A/G-specific adenine glycosylase
MDFIGEVIAWYKQNKRSLPWRNTTDPYIIWLSEIILQQTRVEQGMPYFYRFAEAYPTVSDFASASEDDILKHWQGLGYYSRGRNMHTTAQMVMEEYGGYFPKKYDELIKLKGIGEYTAAAISSFADNEAKAVVDGNVFRVLSRYFGIAEPINTNRGRKDFTELANQLIDQNQAGLSNQAMMEFGSLLCRPKNPHCVRCPLSLSCIALKEGTVAELPAKLKNQKARNRYFNYFVLIKDSQILLNKRGAGDIWQNLHDLPLIETQEGISEHDLKVHSSFTRLFGELANVSRVYGPVKHVLSHQKIFAQFFIVKRFEEHFKDEKDWFYVDLDQVGKVAQPKLIFAFFKNFSNLKLNSIIA